MRPYPIYSDRRLAALKYGGPMAHILALAGRVAVRSPDEIDIGVCISADAIEGV